MSIAEINKIESGIFPLVKGDETQSIHYAAIRERMWVVEHYCAGNIDTTIAYGKWAGDASRFLYIEWGANHWGGWNPETEYHPGFPIVKYRWGGHPEKVDIFVFNSTARGNVLDVNPPIVNGKLNNLWLLTVDPNKYAHWNFNAGRPDIEAEGRWIISQHGYDEVEGWLYGKWKAYQELPVHTDPYEQIPHIRDSSGVRARHHPAERNREDISIKLQTQGRRSYHDGFIGTPPNETYWFDRFRSDMVSEYTRLNGDPADSIQQGPDYREPKKNSAFQDRIQHLIEQNYKYITKVDEDWKLAWQYWYVYGIEMSVDNIAGCSNPVYNRAAGGYKVPEDGWGYKSFYVKGNVVWWWNNFYVCIQDGGEHYEPGVASGWEEYWTHVLYQPNYIKTHPMYVQFSDPLFYCNSSAFEKVLKNIGHYDWYWDTNAEVPWWMYQRYYYLMTEELVDPGGQGFMQDALQRWPKPRGCWRRIWRYTQNWDKTRNQKSRFGKEINIDGKMVSMMWPGELGNPPGYDEQFMLSGALLAYRNTAPDWHWDDLTHQYIITEAQYNQMQDDPSYGWLYKQYYTVIDVEEWFRQAYLNNSLIESRIAERHDPTAIDWIEVLNEQTGLWEDEEEPVFELFADLVNDMRDALLQLNLLRQSTTITRTDYHVDADLGPFDSSLKAFTAGKNYANNKAFAVEGYDYGDVGYDALVIDNPPFGWFTSGNIRHEACVTKYWIEVVVIKEAAGFPSNGVGMLIFDVLVKVADTGVTYPPDQACAVGVAGVFSYRPANVYPGVYERAFIGAIPMTCEQIHDGAGDDPADWVTKCKFEIVPAEPWMDEVMFTNVSVGKDYYIRSEVNVANLVASTEIIWALNFYGFDTSVFEEDLTNYVEV